MGIILFNETKAQNAMLLKILKEFPSPNGDYFI